MADDLGFDLPTDYDEVAGYLVVTLNPRRVWQDDWDGELHATIEDGREELRKCSEAGWTCILLECRRVPGSAVTEPG